MSLTWGHVASIVQDLIRRVLKHDAEADKADISDVYNRGNDFYGWFLCNKMLYSVGHFKKADDIQHNQMKLKESGKETTLQRVNNRQNADPVLILYSTLNPHYSLNL